MRVEYKNPEILKRPDSRIVLKGVEGIWEPESKTLRLYYEGQMKNIRDEIYSTSGDLIMKLIFEPSDTNLESNCGNIIYIEFPEFTRADISTSEVASNITYLEGRGYAIGENILRGINTTNEAKLKNFISKSSWYRYFRINRKSNSTNTKRLDWAGRSISKDYYKKSYSDLQLFCDGVDENDRMVYDFKMSTPCITFYGFATEETYKVEGNNEKLVSKEIVSLENVPGLVISEIPGGTRNFVLSIDSKNLRANLLTIQDFNSEESEIIYQTGFIAEVYDLGGQINTSYPLEITTLSKNLTWHLDSSKTSSIFREGESPVFLFRHDDYTKGVYHTLHVTTARDIDNIRDIKINVSDDSSSDPYFRYEISLYSSSELGNDIVVRIFPVVSNQSSSWVPRMYADIPEPRTLVYKNSKLVFYPIIGPKNADFLVVDPEDSTGTEIDSLEFPEEILGGEYLVKTNGDDTYWGGIVTDSDVFATSYGYTGFVEPPVVTDDSEEVLPEPVVIIPEPVPVEPEKPKTFNFDIPGSDISGAQCHGLWLFPSSCNVRPGQSFTVHTAEVKGSNRIWCREKCLGESLFSLDGEFVRIEGIKVNGCYEASKIKAPMTPGNYKLKFYGSKDKKKVVYLNLKVTSAETGKLTGITTNTNIIAFRKPEERITGASDAEKAYYTVSDYYLLKVWAIYTDNPQSQVLIDFSASDCDFVCKLTKSAGITAGMRLTSQGIMVYRGNDYGVSELIIYSKSDPSIYLDIPVVQFGGKYTYYQLSR